MYPVSPKPKINKLSLTEKSFDGRDFSKTHDRILFILEKICLGGPVTIKDLEKVTPFSRAAIWRAVDSLREYGWIRMRAGDKALQLSNAFEDIFVKSNFTPQEVNQFDPLINHILSEKIYHVDFALFDSLGSCRITESSRISTFDQKKLSLVDCNAALAAQAALTETELSRHINQYLKQADKHEIVTLQSEKHINKLKLIRSNRIIWSFEEAGFSIPLRSDTNTGCAISVCIKNSSLSRAKSQILLLELSEKLIAMASSI